MRTVTASTKSIRKFQQEVIQLESLTKRLKGKFVQLKINNEQETIKIPTASFKEMMNLFIVTNLKHHLISTSQVAVLLGCSRPHVVSLLEKGKIPFTKVGTHRKIFLDDVYLYMEEAKQTRKIILTKMIAEDEELGIYECKE